MVGVPSYVIKTDYWEIRKELSCIIMIQLITKEFHNKILGPDETLFKYFVMTIHVLNH